MLALHCRNESCRYVWVIYNVPHDLITNLRQKVIYLLSYEAWTLIEIFWLNLTYKQQSSWIYRSAVTLLLVLSTLARIINWLQVMCYFMVKMQYLSWVLHHKIYISEKSAIWPILSCPVYQLSHHQNLVPTMRRDLLNNVLRLSNWPGIFLLNI